MRLFRTFPSSRLSRLSDSCVSVRWGNTIRSQNQQTRKDSSSTIGDRIRAMIRREWSLPASTQRTWCKALSRSQSEHYANSLVDPGEVFKPALIEGSSGIIVSHNHPSGNLTPSDQDRNVTDRLKSAGEILGINVLDHIIHGDETEEMVSLMEDL